MHAPTSNSVQAGNPRQFAKTATATRSWTKPPTRAVKKRTAVKASFHKRCIALHPVRRLAEKRLRETVIRKLETDFGLRRAA